MSGMCVGPWLRVGGDISLMLLLLTAYGRSRAVPFCEENLVMLSWHALQPPAFYKLDAGGLPEPIQVFAELKDSRVASAMCHE